MKSIFRRPQVNVWSGPAYRQGWWRRLSPIPGLAAAIMGLGLFGLGVWEPLERIVYTGLFLTRDRLMPTQWDDRLVIIAIDEASLATYGTYPWPRDRYAALLDKLATVQPAAIGFDILMAEATPKDAQLASSIQRSSNVVLAVGGDGQGNAIPVTPTLIEPTQGFVQIGHVKHTPDTDGISRRAFLYERHQGTAVPSFAVALLDSYYHSLNSLITADPVDLPEINPSFLTASSRFDQTRPIWLNWPGLTRPSSPDGRQSTHGLTTLSFADVMADDGELLKQLQNKIVLVGYTAIGIVGDAENPFRTPFEQEIPTAGVYLHAALIDNLLNDRFLSRLPPSWTLALIGLSGIGSSLLIKPLGLPGRLVVVLGGGPVWFVVAYASFMNGWWLPIAAPIGTGLLGLVACQLIEQRERQALMDLFSINLSPEIARVVWQHKDELLSKGQIHAQELTATVLFVDIRGFTQITESLSSEALLSWLNRYFEVMTDCIMAHGGVVDKYIGDAIMAAFGAPVSRPQVDTPRQDALSAVMASVTMVEQLQKLNQEFLAQGLPRAQFGIGLHTGTVIAGTVGNHHRASYSLFGDTVNIAARLEDMTKQLPQEAPYPILLSDSTYQHISDRCQVAEHGHLKLENHSTTAYSLARLNSVDTRSSIPSFISHP